MQFVANQLLDWEPQVDFLTGLRQTIKYVKSSELMAAESGVVCNQLSVISDQFASYKRPKVDRTGGVAER